MAYTVPRPKLTFAEKIYLPSIVAGLAITFKHFKRMLRGRDQGDHAVSGGEMGCAHAGTLSRRADTGDGRARPRALRGLPALRVHLPAARDHHQSRGDPADDKFAKVEKYPKEFEIDMIRCIYCGMCEEVCPEQAIFLRKDYAITGTTPRRNGARQEEALRAGRRLRRPRPQMEPGEMTACKRDRLPAPMVRVTSSMSPILFWFFALLMLVFGVARRRQPQPGGQRAEPGRFVSLAWRRSSSGLMPTSSGSSRCWSTPAR